MQMPKSKKIDINQILLKAHKLGVKTAIEKAALTGTSLVVYKDGKVRLVKPAFKYICVPRGTPNKKHLPIKKSSAKKK